MGDKLTKVLKGCSFITNKDKSIILKNKSIFNDIPVSKVLLRRLTETASTVNEKISLLKKNKTLLKGLPSSCIALLVYRSVDRFKARLPAVKRLKELGVTGQSIGLILSNGDINEKIKGVETLKKLGVEGQNVGLILQFGDVGEKIKSVRILQNAGIKGHALGAILQTGE